MRGSLRPSELRLDWSHWLIELSLIVRPACYSSSMNRNKTAAGSQEAFELRTWGGVRAGAGPKSSRDRAALPHRTRGEFKPYQPLHVTIRVADHVWNLRSHRSFSVVRAALEALRRRTGVRVIHFSVQGNHIHLIMEAEDKRALANGVRRLSIRLARGLNRMMSRSGPVLDDRYHVHVLRTLAEARNAVRYAAGNFESHAARRGERVSGRWLDPFSSDAMTIPARGQRELFTEPVTSAPRTWMLRNANGKDAKPSPALGLAT
jgi:putative transposase